MKAYHLSGHAGAGRLVRADVGKPEPASGEVRIRVERQVSTTATS